MSNPLFILGSIVVSESTAETSTLNMVSLHHSNTDKVLSEKEHDMHDKMLVEEKEKSDEALKGLEEHEEKLAEAAEVRLEKEKEAQAWAEKYLATIHAGKNAGRTPPKKVASEKKNSREVSQANYKADYARNEKKDAKAERQPALGKCDRVENQKKGTAVVEDGEGERSQKCSKKIQRLKKKAEQMSNNDLMEVFMLRSAEEKEKMEREMKKSAAASVVEENSQVD